MAFETYIPRNTKRTQSFANLDLEAKCLGNRRRGRSNTDIMMASLSVRGDENLCLADRLSRAHFDHLNREIDRHNEAGTLYEVEKEIEGDEFLSNENMSNTLLTYMALREKGLAPEFPRITSIWRNMDYVITLFDD